MSTKSCDQLKKVQPNSGAISQSQSQDQDKDSQAKQKTEAPKNARKNKKQRAHQVKQNLDY